MTGNDWQGDVLHQLTGDARHTPTPPSPPAIAPAAPALPDHPPEQQAPPEPQRPRTEPRPQAPPQHQPQHQPQQSGPRVSLPTPLSAATVDPELARAEGKPRNGDSAARRTGRSVRKLIGSSAAREVESVTKVAQELQQPITTGRQIAVTSIRGGAGKTTVAALLGRTFEHYRHDPVLTLEADPALGTLPVRLGAPAIRWTCSDLARIVDPSMQLTDITGYLVQLPDGGWLLPASQGKVGTRLEPSEYESVMVALRRYFAITVVDSETLPSDLARTALVAAHARVLVTPATLEGVASTRSVLNWMAEVPRPKMLHRTVVVLVSTSPHMTLDIEAAAAHLHLEGVRVLALPYDRHLAAGGPIRTSLLAQSTRDSTAQLAAELLNRATGGGRR
ncbi:hypothetical protein ABZW18_16280 [Streptomyces sp. NPDC004647]|uniref:hypothetical protein n=1 Tax=Streptomyces sp. NPDC004647 TaxID=3154671 RepID=UPI0033A561E4